MDNPSRSFSIPRLKLLGAEVDVLTSEQVLAFAAQAVRLGERAIIANHNLHSVYLYKKNSDMRRYYDQAALIEIDSTPMIAWAKLMGHDVNRSHRATYLDFKEEFWQSAVQNNWRVFHVGGAKQNNELSRTHILNRHPNVILGTHNGYFNINGPENNDALNDIMAFKPDILLVGMGMPRQEFWIMNNLPKLPHCVIFNVGAAFDYEAGVMYAPPRWTGQAGIEWFVRFLHEPRRLFQRYFIEPWFLLPEMWGDIRLRLFGAPRTQKLRKLGLERD
jgi:N-acetylglucosaminyldiphosphoundecaprenol N-acetyl-beta-D-mannosaminyltransferase